MQSINLARKTRVETKMVFMNTTQVVDMVGEHLVKKLELIKGASTVTAWVILLEILSARLEIRGAMNVEFVGIFLRDAGKRIVRYHKDGTKKRMRAERRKCIR
jgi:CRISPR/Cas system-associated endonuclease Cas3-HD